MKIKKRNDSLLSVDGQGIYICKGIQKLKRMVHEFCLISKMLNDLTGDLANIANAIPSET
jgi:hypothetical protein